MWGNAQYNEVWIILELATSCHKLACTGCIEEFWRQINANKIQKRYIVFPLQSLTGPWDSTFGNGISQQLLNFEIEIWYICKLNVLNYYI